jgi:hypothetical protein
MTELTGDRLLEVLRSLDDPEHLDRPRDYDHAAASAAFDSLVAGLDQAFECACEVDRQHDGSAMHGWLVIPAAATETGRFVWLSVSTFGPLAAATPGYPGFPTEASRGQDFAGEDRRRVEATLARFGYLSVDEPLLWQPYDGFAPAFPTWWHRYFGGQETG